MSEMLDSCHAFIDQLWMKIASCCGVEIERVGLILLFTLVLAYFLIFRPHLVGSAKEKKIKQNEIAIFISKKPR